MTQPETVNPASNTNQHTDQSRIMSANDPSQPATEPSPSSTSSSTSAATSMSTTPAILQLTAIGDDRFRVANEGDPATYNVVFGGQLLAQMIMAATVATRGKSAKTIHAIFARAGRIDATTELQVESNHDGRAFATVTVTAWQGERLCARALVLMHADEDDLIAHHTPRPEVPRAEVAGTVHVGGFAFPGAEYVVVGDVDLYTKDAPVGPAQLDVYYRSTATPDDRAVNQAVLAWGTDGFLIATAMRPHAGINQELAHDSISTGVVSHTLSFHRPFSLRDWVLMVHESPFAGGGRSHGRCLIFDAGGDLVASYVQDNMVRMMPAGKGM
jgi:acyl-CoA thioesterase